MKKSSPQEIQRCMQIRSLENSLDRMNYEGTLEDIYLGLTKEQIIEQLDILRKKNNEI